MDSRKGEDIQRKSDYTNETLWENLSTVLKPRIKSWIRTHTLPSWRGQEDDIADDILQDTLEKLWRTFLKAEKGIGRAIEALERFAFRTARNCCIDRWRKDRRLLRLDDGDHSYEDQISRTQYVDPEEIVVDKEYEHWRCSEVSLHVLSFSPKSQLALLIEFASKLTGRGEPAGPLQRALLARGVDLNYYRRDMPADPKLKGRHASLVSQGYKKLRGFSYAG